MNRIWLLTFFILNVFSFSLPSSALAQRVKPSEKDSTKNFHFRPVPYVNYDRTQGFSLGAILIGMYKINPSDTLSPESLSGILGLYTTEKNAVYLAFQQFYFGQNKWRGTFAIGAADRGFQFYSDVGAAFVDYNTASFFVYTVGQRMVIPKLYLGPTYTYVETETEIGEGFISKKTFNALGLKLTYDHRENVYYPTNSSLTNFTWFNTPEGLGNEFVTNKLDFDYSLYRPIADDRDVWASRVKLGLGIGDVVFEQQYIIGEIDIRGYTQGEHRGDNIATIQTEYRWNGLGKAGFVGFFGLATVWGNEDISASNGEIFPAGGVGFRYTVFEEQHMNVGLDAAAGKDDWGIYFRIAEAF